MTSLCASLLGTVLSVSNSVEAYTPKSGGFGEVLTKDYDKYDPFSWNQSTHPFDGTFGPLGIDFRAASCMIQAAAFTKVKLGIEPLGYDAVDMKKELDSVDGYAYGFADYSKIDWGNEWTMLEGDGGAGYSYRDGTYADAVKAWNEGYMVVMRVMSPAGYHQIAIDHIKENGDMVVFDSGFNNQIFTDTYSYSDVSDLVLFKSNSGKKAKDLPTLYNHRNGEQIYQTFSKTENAAKTEKELKAEEETRKVAAAKEEEKKVDEAEKALFNQQVADAKKVLKLIPKVKVTEDTIVVTEKELVSGTPSDKDLGKSLTKK